MSAKALVLGGGGPAGAAWQIGMLAGLAEHGVNLAGADLVIGTSAGALTGASVRAGHALGALYSGQLRPAALVPPPRPPLAAAARMSWAARSARDPAQALARIGRLAEQAVTVPESERRAALAQRLPVRDWPPAPLHITAVDAATGELTVFDADSGVPLIDAIGASCAEPGVWPPVTIGGRRYIDGGVHSPANADLAAGCQRAVVVAPRTRGMTRRDGVADQVAGLTRAGTVVTLIEPDAAAARVISRGPAGTQRQAAAAQAGFAQAAEAARPAAAVWAAAAPS